MKPSDSKTAILALIAAVASASVASAADGKKIDFVKDVAPIFKTACVNCHGLDPDKPKKKAAAKLRLDDEAEILKGGKSGAAVIPGDSKNSLLFKLLSGPVTVPGDFVDKEIKPMPKVKRGEKFKPLTDEQIAVIKQWIDQTPQQAAK
jgi:mono/diheme cytochrome c family protein